jgi:hypothetical protein
MLGYIAWFGIQRCRKAEINQLLVVEKLERGLPPCAANDRVALQLFAFS